MLAEDQPQQPLPASGHSRRFTSGWGRTAGPSRSLGAAASLLPSLGRIALPSPAAFGPVWTWATEGQTYLWQMRCSASGLSSGTPSLSASRWNSTLLGVSTALA